MMDALVIAARLSFDVIVERFYKNGANDKWAKHITSTLRAQYNMNTLYNDVIYDDERLHVLVTYNHVIFIAICENKYPVSMLAELLEQVASVIALRLKRSEDSLTQSVIENNYISVLLILDEMLDGGLPLSLEHNAIDLLVPPKMGLMECALQQMSPKNILNEFSASFSMTPYASEEKVRDDSAANQWSKRNPGEGMGSGSGVGTGSGILGCGSGVWWRRAGTTDSDRKMTLDLVETLNCVVNTQSEDSVVSSFLIGVARMDCQFPGMPSVRMIPKNFNVKGRSFCMSFHPCVQTQKWIDEQVIAFIPPRGPFQLFDYSVESSSVSYPLSVSARFTFPNIQSVPNGSSTIPVARFHITLLPQTTFCALNDVRRTTDPIALERVNLTIPLPLCVSDVSCVEFSAGTMKFLRKETALNWSFPRFVLHTQRAAPVKCDGTLLLSPTIYSQEGCHSVHSNNAQYLYPRPPPPPPSACNAVNWPPFHSTVPLDLQHFRPIAKLTFHIEPWSMTNISIDSIEANSTTVTQINCRRIVKGRIEYRL